MASIAQQARLAGFRENIRIRGRKVITDTDEKVTVLVSDAQPLQDPTGEVKAMNVIFATIAVEAGALKSPREVGWFHETDIGGRNYKVIEFLESSADGVSEKFLCEAQRKKVPTDEQDPEPE